MMDLDGKASRLLLPVTAEIVLKTAVTLAVLWFTPSRVHLWAEAIFSARMISRSSIRSKS